MNNREQFEEWVDSNFPFKKDRFHIFRDEYKSQFTRQLWEAWQASRAAVDVEILSEPFIAIKKDATNYDFYNAGIESAKRAITNAGIRVKDC